MKALFITTSFLFISFCILGQGKIKKVKYKKLKKKGIQLFYKEKPLSGSYQLKHHKYKTEFSYFSDGKREGISYIYQDSFLVQKRNYYKGLKEGKQFFYILTDDRLYKELNYKNDTLDSWQFHYYPYLSANHIKTKEFHRNGIKEHTLHYDLYEKLEKECFFNKHEGYCVRGINGLENGIDSIFYEDQKISSIKTYINDSLSFQVNVHYSLEKDSLTFTFIDALNNSEKYIFVSRYADIDDLFLIYSFDMSDHYSAGRYYDSEEIQYNYPNLCELFDSLLLSYAEFYELFHIDQNGDKFQAVYYMGSDCVPAGCTMKRR